MDTDLTAAAPTVEGFTQVRTATALMALDILAAVVIRTFLVVPINPTILAGDEVSSLVEGLTAVTPGLSVVAIRAAACTQDARPVAAHLQRRSIIPDAPFHPACSEIRAHSQTGSGVRSAAADWPPLADRAARPPLPEAVDGTVSEIVRILSRVRELSRGHGREAHREAGITKVTERRPTNPPGPRFRTAAPTGGDQTNHATPERSGEVGREKEARVFPPVECFRISELDSAILVREDSSSRIRNSGHDRWHLMVRGLQVATVFIVVKTALGAANSGQMTMETRSPSCRICSVWRWVSEILLCAGSICSAKV